MDYVRCQPQAQSPASHRVQCSLCDVIVGIYYIELAEMCKPPVLCLQAATNNTGYPPTMPAFGTPNRYIKYAHIWGTANPRGGAL